MNDNAERARWRGLMSAANALMAEHGSVDAAAAYLRTITPSNGAVDGLIPLLHAKGYSQVEIAGHLDIAQSRVSRRLRRLVELGLAEPPDPARGGGGRPAVSQQVKAARVFRTAARDLLLSGLAGTAQRDREQLLEIIDCLDLEIAEILAPWREQGESEQERA